MNYPGLESDKYHERAMKYMPKGGCGVVSFELKGGRKAAETFMKHLKLAAIETHVADARTCCLNPATSTHRQMVYRQALCVFHAVLRIKKTSSQTLRRHWLRLKINLYRDAAVDVLVTIIVEQHC